MLSQYQSTPFAFRRLTNDSVVTEILELLGWYPGNFCVNVCMKCHTALAAFRTRRTVLSLSRLGDVPTRNVVFCWGMSLVGSSSDTELVAKILSDGLQPIIAESNLYWLVNVEHIRVFVPAPFIQIDGVGIRMDVARAIPIQQA